MYIVCSSGKLRLGRYLRNSGSMGWTFEWQEYDSATTICEKTFITCIRVIVPAPNVPVVDVFGTGNFHQHTVPLNRYKPHNLLLLSICSFPPLPKPVYQNWTVKALEMAVLNG